MCICKELCIMSISLQVSPEVFAEFCRKVSPEVFAEFCRKVSPEVFTQGFFPRDSVRFTR
jgi:hypothetical protein